MAVVLVALLFAQAPATLGEADSLLIKGDTARGIGVLSTLVDDEPDDVRLAAAFALEWIGRTSRWPEASEAFRDARPRGYIDDHFDTFGPLEHQAVQYFRDGQPLVDIYATRPEAQCNTPDKVRQR